MNVQGGVLFTTDDRANSTDEIARLATQIVTLARIRPDSGPGGFATPLQAAEDIYNWRRQREKWFDGDLFQDPAWDLLLDLFIAHERNRRVYLSSACVAACSPNTTAMRWLGTLETKKLVRRTCDPNDRRRIYVELTPPAYARLTGYLLGLRL